MKFQLLPTPRQYVCHVHDCPEGTTLSLYMRKYILTLKAISHNTYWLPFQFDIKGPKCYWYSNLLSCWWKGQLFKFSLLCVQQ